MKTLTGGKVMSIEKGKRRQYSAEEKFQIVEEGRLPDTTISAVCRRYQVSSSQYYRWAKQVREGGLAALKQGGVGDKRQAANEAAYEEEIQRLQAVITELTKENLDLKKGRWA
jgi:transposase